MEDNAKMTSRTDGTRLELSPHEATELVAAARAACTGAEEPARVREVRDALEASIRVCNRWLSMLAEWVSRGLVVEAASVDQSYPDLCKVAQVLEMPDDRLAWDQACNRAGVRPNSSIDGASLTMLSDGIGDASALDDFVQRFQVAVLGRRPISKRMAVLNELVSAAPRNPAIRELAKQYEAEAIASLEQECKQAASQGQSQDLVDALDSIEGLGWQSHFSGEFLDWLRSRIAQSNSDQARRKFAQVASRTEAAFGSRDLMLLGALQEECEEIERIHGVEQDEESRARTRLAFAWADEERARLRNESSHAEACEELRRALDQRFAYTELEPIRGRVLGFGLGIPEDLEGRFETAHSHWRSARRRKVAAVVAATCVAVTAVVAGIVWLSRETEAHSRAVRRAEEIGRLADSGQFENANRLSEEAFQREPWIEQVAEMRAVRERLASELPKYLARREEVKASLARPIPADEASMVARITEIERLLSQSDQLTRLTDGEASDAAALVRQVQSQLDRLRSERAQRLSSEFDELRRTGANLPAAADRAKSERGSREGTEAYVTRLRELDAKLRAFLLRASPDTEERKEAAVILDRVSRDIAAAEELLPRIAETTRLLGLLGTIPVSESEYASTAERLARDCADVLDNMDPAIGTGLKDTLRTAEAARGVEHWRQRVVPAIRAADAGGQLRLPSRRAQAVEVEAALVAHLQQHPESPFVDIARRWSRWLRPALGTRADSAGTAALAQVSDLGVSELSLVGLRNQGALFVRDDANKTGVLEGPVMTRADLLRPVDQLPSDPPTFRKLDPIGKREPTTWKVALDALRGQVVELPVPEAQVAWLRLMKSIQGGRQPTELVAIGPILLELFRSYEANLADREGDDRELCDLLRRMQTKYQSVDTADWPRLALAAAKDPKRIAHLNETLRLLEELQVLEPAARARLQLWQRTEAEARPPVIAGVLLPPQPGQTTRRSSPATLTGDFRILIRRDGTDSMLVPVRFQSGVLEGPAEGAAPYALIYKEQGR